MIRHVFKIVRNSWKIFCGIFIEQAVVFVVLMLVVVSVFGILYKIYSPGLLNTDNSVCFGYMLSEINDNTGEVDKRVDILIAWSGLRRVWR